MISLPPIWLLDVGGVINANRPGWGGPPHKRGVWSAVDQYEYTIRWAPILVDRIRDLHENSIVEVGWCTTWCAEADRPGAQCSCLPVEGMPGPSLLGLFFLRAGSRVLQS
ncbi:hypothetical protein GA0070618_3547 [Micromonospora echinospora]|uniref:Uncharacterized protein n=1 Tax=Micromonospora echinospora TaxID=1877 RepID=A0A1C4Y2J5_MICEC|nr:hypothetical protein [Micromonospora echinospora]SCF14949.1 hypothetical protein GA0070618_3547 [Micromonospora echinospora]